MLTLALGALIGLVLSPVAAQTAYIQQPSEPATAAKAGTNGNHVATSDIRRIHRSTTGAGTDEVPPGMVAIPGGKVVVGTPVDQVESLGQRDVIQMRDILAETPRHTAEVGDFLIDVTEVTNLQWKVFLDATGRKPSQVMLEYSWPGGNIPDGQEYYPVGNVNIPEIRNFLKWAGKRLPSEEEWTRAARGDDERTYPWGNGWKPNLCQSGMNVPNLPVAVGSFPDGASPYGVLDMLGNVFEWTDSPFRAFEGFESMSYGKGKTASTIVPEFNSTQRVIKGGTYTTGRSFTRIDARIGYNKVDTDAGLGFRCARSGKAGVEAIRNAMEILVPPYFQPSSSVGLDEQDLFANEVTSIDTSRKVITGYRYVAFAHRAADTASPWTKLYKTARDEYVPLGVLATSEALQMPDQKVVLPAGEYTLHFKAEGESKAWKERQKQKKEEEKEAKKNGKKPDDEEPPAPPADGAAAAGGSLEASVPWPGVASIHDVAEDIDYPQDKDLILLMNASNVVVGYLKPDREVKEQEVTPIGVTTGDGGKTYQIEFTLDQRTGKRSPRFAFTLHLAGDPL